ncbi:hypothetical protein BFW01_g7889 [Lasiodiplodia theobromae]|uniref:Cellulose-binding family ii protein n=1 Tax=Lasiodiplodia theobromae TaxID=45133 RepID=UPI0015C34A82|nr:Cellulose-binding family ii protein [Lasiodiplodia theobromae]KAF4534504.1 Cellulose-binding family ii protein [Lasiodiplodia theobromae]KAF9636993.1 hypothetical protein BFW01_g7889 [Lasiodiplodia theobromae]
MKAVTALPLLAALAAQAHPIQGSQEAPGICKFDRAPALAARSSVENPAVSKRASSNSTSTWSPPSSLATGLDEVWEHEMNENPSALEFKNYGYDHIMETKGKVQYCVRWDSTKSVTAAQRASIEKALSKMYNKWVSAALVGFDGFPYESVDVSVVGWATKDKSLLEGDTSGITVHTGHLDADGAPECDPACGRAIHYADGDYSGCSGGDADRYDVSLWLSDTLDDGAGGYGGDWGQQVGADYMLQNVDEENIHILLHEMGHTLGLDDFYDWTPTGVTNFIMNAGSAMEITEFDAWMARDWFRHLKSRWDL